MNIETEASFAKMRENPKYDAEVKEFFKNREVIAPILKAAVEEYKDSSIGDNI